MTTHSFLPYSRQSISTSDLEAVQRSLQGEWVTRGPCTDQFEKELAEYCGVKHVITFNSGSTALAAAYFAAEVNSSDRILTTPNTYIATVGSGFLQGATPVFIDIDLKSGNLDLESLKPNLKRFSLRGRSIIVPVHFAGIAVDMNALERLITEPDTVIIEDAAHAIGSCYPTGERVGSCCYSQMTIFSFHPAKTMTTGEGGAVTTNDDALAHRLRLYRNNGIEREAPYIYNTPQPWYYECQAITGNFHMTEMQAALGSSQLLRLDSFVTKRRELMAQYRAGFADLAHVKMLTAEQDALTAFHLAVVLIDFAALRSSRSTVMQLLKEGGIGSQLHYIPLYRHPILANTVGDLSTYFPRTEDYFAQALSLPLYGDLTSADVSRVINQLKEIVLSKS